MYEITIIGFPRFQFVDDLKKTLTPYVTIKTCSSVANKHMQYLELPSLTLLLDNCHNCSLSQFCKFHLHSSRYFGHHN